MYRKLLPLQEDPINLSNFENPIDEIKNYKKQQSFFYFCKGCGKQVNTTRKYWNSTFLCRSCKRKETNLRAYGVECIFQSTEKKLNKRL